MKLETGVNWCQSCGCCGQIGGDWESVVEKVCRGRYQPLLLLYQREHPPLIDTRAAPTQTYRIHSIVSSQRAGNYPRLVFIAVGIVVATTMFMVLSSSHSD